jgi:choline dehydrogenase-like flavoprotein
MLVSANDLNPSTCGQIDAIIVGAGAVGLAMAVRMARAGKKVVLLEAGPSGPSDLSQTYFRTAVASGHLLPGLHVGRFRCLGGTTNFWGGQLVPFSESVFMERPWVSEAGWNIRLEHISPYYDQAFELLGLKNVVKDDETVWSNLGIEPPPQTDRISPIFTRWTPESNFAIHFKDDILHNANLKVVLEAQVGRLQVDDLGDVIGVEMRFTDRPPLLLNGSKVVLANGTIEISRLLLLPDNAGRKTPWADNEWIGRGYIDHVDCYAGSVEPLDPKRFSNLFDNAFLGGLKYSPKLKLADKAQVDQRLLDISSHFVFRSSVSEHIGNLKILVKGLLKGRVDRSALSDPLALLKASRFVVPMALRYLRYRRMTNFSDGGIQLRLTAEQSPMPDSAIRLRDELDQFGLPLVEVDWRIRDDDLASIATFAGFVKDYLEGSGLAKVTLDERLMAVDPGFLDDTDDANHQMGGARMGSDGDTGVVDTDCAVFGTRNLYVAGAAVFPVSGFANPTFTAIALGLRLADHLCGLPYGESHAGVA